MTKVKVDFAGELSIANEFSLKSGAAYKVLSENGPAGGWPELEIEGSEEEIKSFLMLQCGGDESLVKDALECPI